MSSGEASVVRVAPEDPSVEEVIICLLPSSSSSSSSSLTVSAPVPLLSRVPYFATRLEECWKTPGLTILDWHRITSSPPELITLECAPGSSPHAYLECLRLTGLSPRDSLSKLDSVTGVLEVLPVLDHLLLQEFWDACMEFLASIPWSMKEEDSIRATISALSMEPSTDVKERLDTSQDGATLQFIFFSMLSEPSLEDAFCALCQKCLKSTSAPFREAFHTILLKMMASLSAFTPLDRDWYVLVKLLLAFTDGQQVILDLVNCKSLLRSLSSPQKPMEKEASLIFHLVLEKVLKREVLLSNSQRAMLVEWSGSGSVGLDVKEGSRFDLMRLRLAETLPFSDPVRKNMMRDKPESMPEWADQVAHRVGQMDEVRLEAFCDNFRGEPPGLVVVNVCRKAPN